MAFERTKEIIRKDPKSFWWAIIDVILIDIGLVLLMEIFHKVFHLTIK